MKTEKTPKQVLFMNISDYLSKKIYLNVLLIFLFTLLPSTSFANDLEEYWIECEKCVNGQKVISDAIDMYQKDSNEKDFEIRSEEDYKKFLKLAYDRKYIKEPSAGAKGQCEYRYNKENGDLYCIKHGSLESVKDYKYYKDAHESKKKENMVFSLVGVGLLIYAIFFW